MKKMLFLAVALVLVLASCDDVFTTSLGTPRKVDSSKITVSPDNIDDWVARAKDDPALTDALLEKFKEKTGNGSTPEEAAYANGGISLATSASGTGSIIFTDGLDSLTEMLETGDFNEEKGKELLVNMLDGFSESDNAQKSSEYIAEIAVNCISSEDDVPTFSPAFVEAMKPEEAGMTMLLLTMAVVDETGVDINNLDNEDGLSALVDGLGTTEDGKITVTETATPKTKVLAAYINLVTQEPKFKDDLLGGMFGKLLGGKSESGSIDGPITDSPTA